MSEQHPERSRGESCDCACLKDALTRAEKAEEERDEAVDWGHIVDRHGTDGFDALGEKWLAMEAIQRMTNAVASVFSKWASEDIMVRFRKHITAVTHQAFVEGCLVGVRAELVKTEAAESRALSLEQANALMKEAVEAIADGEGDAQEICRQTLESLRTASLRGEGASEDE